MSDLNFDSLLGDSSVGFKCPNCNTDVPVKLSDVGETIKCPNCGVKINLTKDKSFDKSVDEINSRLKDLEDTLNSLGE